MDGPKIVPSGHSIQQLRFMFKGLHVTVPNNGLHTMEKNTAEMCFTWTWYVQNGLIFFCPFKIIGFCSLIQISNLSGQTLSFQPGSSFRLAYKTLSGLKEDSGYVFNPSRPYFGSKM